jgi:7-cyano-7-deazaguanine synthase
MAATPFRTSPRAVVLLSGGLDSTTVLAMAREQGFEVFGLTINYRQRHDWELHCARAIARAWNVADHRIIDIDLRQFGGSALTSEAEVPKHRRVEELQPGIPITYVPARNTVFLSYALAWAEVLGARDIFIGVNALDYSGYPDCRPEFIAAFEAMANLATRAGVEGDPFRIHAPLIHMTKAEIIRRGLELGVDYAMTSSCYDPGPAGLACGRCDACLLRLKGFSEAGMEDPLTYQSAADHPPSEAPV